METMLPKITDYWDEQVGAIDRMAQALDALAPDDRPAALEQIRHCIGRHVGVLDDGMVLVAALAAADDLYKAACSTGYWDHALAEYLDASAGTFWRLFAERGFTLQYLVDNVFDDLERPLELFPLWYGAAGLVYLSPQVAARQLMEVDHGPEAPFTELLPAYDREARHVTATAMDACHDAGRSFALVDADSEEATFRSAFDRAGKPGILTVFRDEPPDPGTKVHSWFPR